MLLEFVFKSGLDSPSLYHIEVLALNVVKLRLSVQAENHCQGVFEALRLFRNCMRTNPSIEP